MNNVDVDSIENIKKLLEQVPVKLVETYERKVLRGESLRAMVKEYDRLETKSKSFLRVYSLLAYSLVLPVLVLIVFTQLEYSIKIYLEMRVIITVITWSVLFVIVLLMSQSKWSTVTEKMHDLSKVFVAFNKAVCDMKPFKAADGVTRGRVAVTDSIDLSESRRLVFPGADEDRDCLFQVRWFGVRDPMSFSPGLREIANAPPHGYLAHGEQFTGSKVVMVPHLVSFQDGDVFPDHGVKQFSTNSVSVFPDVLQGCSHVGGVVHSPAAAFRFAGISLLQALHLPHRCFSVHFSHCTDVGEYFTLLILVRFPISDLKLIEYTVLCLHGHMRPR